MQELRDIFGLWWQKILLDQLLDNFKWLFGLIEAIKVVPDNVEFSLGSDKLLRVCMVHSLLIVLH